MESNIDNVGRLGHNDLFFIKGRSCRPNQEVAEMIIKLCGVSRKEIEKIEKTIQNMNQKGKPVIELLKAEKGQVSIRAVDSYGKEALELAYIVLSKTERFSTSGRWFSRQKQQNQ